MAETTNVPPFRPSNQWYEGWPFGVETLVQFEARITGSTADLALASFLGPLTHDPATADHAKGNRVHFWGWFTVESTPLTEEGGWMLGLASAGENGFVFGECGGCSRRQAPCNAR